MVYSPNPVKTQEIINQILPIKDCTTQNPKLLYRLYKVKNYKLAEEILLVKEFKDCRFLTRSGMLSTDFNPTVEETFLAMHTRYWTWPRIHETVIRWWRYMQFG
jgi:hypothetical protein